VLVDSSGGLHTVEPMADTSKSTYTPATISGRVDPISTVVTVAPATYEKVSGVDMSPVNWSLRSSYRKDLGALAEFDFSSLSDSDLDVKVAQISRDLHEVGVAAKRAEALALLGEVAARTLGLRPYLVQHLGAMVVADGNVAEMATGEGKTLSVALAAALGALAGHQVHVMTANDYLAGRDAKDLSGFFARLGLSVGVTLEQGEIAQRADAYQCNVVYGTAMRFGFDFLMDHMVIGRELQVQRGHDWAIVDEADALLIDEARTPLIISGDPFVGTERAHWAVFAAGLGEDDYELDWANGAAWLTETGIAKAEAFAEVENLYEHPNLAELASKALFAQTMMIRDRDYILVGEGDEARVAIVDEGTGRVLEGRRWQDGLHAAVEAKEGVVVRGERRTMATVTIPAYLDDYELLGGMSGTAEDAAEELAHLYDLQVISIPTHRPRIRIDEPDSLYLTKHEKFEAMASDIAGYIAQGRPILIGAPTVADAEDISASLSKIGVAHSVLSARDNLREAEIIAEAGRPGAVTVATNMAGRGVDILLGGDTRGVGPEEAKELAENRQKVLAAGGLVVMATARHSSKRIDNQLRGRAGRQGEPGTTKFYLSFEDDLLVHFSTSSVSSAFSRVAKLTGGALRSKRVTSVVDDAQKRAELSEVAQRQHLAKLDRVYQEQQREVYRFRDELLSCGWRENVRAWWKMTARAGALPNLLAGFDAHDDEALVAFLRQNGGTLLGDAVVDEFDEVDEEMSFDVGAVATGDIEAFAERSVGAPDADIDYLVRAILVETLDASWRNQLLNLDALREGIDLRRSVGDVATQFGFEAFDLFARMMARMGAIGVAKIRSTSLEVAEPVAASN